MSEKVINHVNIRDGIAYEVNSDIPYTGKYNSEDGFESGSFKDGFKDGEWRVEMIVIVPVVYYKNQESKSYKDVVGVFSDSNKAEAAVEDFIEGFLEQERASYEVNEIDYREYEVDKGPLEDIDLESIM